MYANHGAILVELARKKWNIQMLAEKAGISAVAIRSWWSGDKPKKVSTMSAGKVAEALGVDVLQVFTV